MRPDWKTCLRVGVSAFALFLCIHYWNAVAGALTLGLRAATPIFLGCAAAFVLNIPMAFFERRYFPGSRSPLVARTRRGVCLLLAFLSVAVLLTLLALLVVPELGQCVTLLVAQVPGTLEHWGKQLAQAQWLAPAAAEYLQGINWQQLLQQVVKVAVSGFGSVANLAAGVISSVISGMVTGLMALIIAIYILVGKERLAGQLKALARRYVRESWRRTARHTLDVVSDCFHDYIVGQCTEAVILGALCAAGMVLLRFPYAAVVGATVGFTALIPVAGAYIGGAVGFLLVLTQSPLKALLFLLYLVVLQQLENNLIYPKVVGKSLGLPGIWVLCAVLIGGGVKGVLGMVLGVPLAAAAYRLLSEDVARAKP